MNLVTLTHPQSPAAEAYRTLRANLIFATLETPAQAVLVAAPSAAEDKSVALANLGVVLAQSEKRVLLVDADLRRPALHRLFGLEASPGLAEALAGSGDAPRRGTGVPGLAVMTGGQAPSNPSDLLNSGRMKRLIQALRSEADYVLFDAPPMLAASDAAILASLVDATLLVIVAGKTRREQAQSAKDALARAHARLLGAVMLNMRGDRQAGRY